MHPESERFNRVYVATHELLNENPAGPLRAMLGTLFDDLPELSQEILKMIWLAGEYSAAGGLNAKQVYRLLRSRMPDELQKRGEDEFYRAVRYRVERLAPDKKKHPLTDAEVWVFEPDRMLGLRGSASRPVFGVNPTYQSSRGSLF